MLWSEPVMNSVLKEKLALLPAAPGVYLMKDAAGTIIYVGKAISLKNRVRQYFQQSKTHTPKVQAMVSHIWDFDTILVANETEAFSLESNLIKQYKPKYNILLKDDKHFPYVRIDLKQDFPRVEIVRRIHQDGATYLGPYLSTTYIRERMTVIREHFPIRYCKKDIGKMIARRERPCLMHQIGRCCAPCSGKISREQYHSVIAEILPFLSGKSQELIDKLHKDMEAASDAMDYERAAMLRDRIRAISAMDEKQIAISVKSLSADVLAAVRLGEKALVYAMFVRKGKIVNTERFSMDSAHDDSSSSVLEAFLPQFYSMHAGEPPREILLSEPISEMTNMRAWLCAQAGHAVELIVPQRGEKRRLTEMAVSNGMEELRKERVIQEREWERSEGALVALSQIIGLDTIPERMECFDNSHLMGKFTVSSMVVFSDGKPDKTQYRHFRIRTETAGDDLAAMQEALTRRFSRDMPRPDLVILDGGKTQLDVGLAVLQKLSMEDIPMIALAETGDFIYLPGKDLPIILPRNAPALHLVERIRDEAHRFAITYHRSVRQRSELYSILDEVEGIGEKRKRALFDAFVTMDAMKQADPDALCAVPGMSRPAAEALYRHLHTESDNR